MGVFELAKYISDPLRVGDVINIKNLEGERFQGTVIRVEYNYCGQENVHKILFKSYDKEYNKEHDDVSGEMYMAIVIQEINR